MSNQNEQILLGQETLRTSLRQLTEAALQYDNERLPEFLRAIGAIASASVELAELIPQEVPTIIALNPLEIIPEQAPSYEAIAETIVEPDLTITRPTEPLLEETTVSAPASIIDTLPSRYQKAVEYMINHRDEILKPGDIANHIDGATPAARKQALQKLVVLLKQDNQDLMLGQSGEKGARKYWVSLKAGSALLADQVAVQSEVTEPPAVVEAEPSISQLESLDDTDLGLDIVTLLGDGDLPETAILEAPRAVPSPLSMPPRRFGPASITKKETAVEAEQVVTLTNWGLEFAQNGHREIKLNGERLRMREVAAETLLELAQHEQGLAFHELLAALNNRGKNIDPKFLQGVLEEVRHALADQAQSKWTDEIRPDDDGGSRYIKLAGSKPLEVYPDFLVQVFGKRQ
ncbi:MAG: hypothetical protein QFB87_03875 [Patescibacteria group bacterium]|nr:hypothetical protein [Patescibacteria group bacterium]